MKISYNWLRTYLPQIPDPQLTSTLLTDIGLEVESLEQVQSVKGGLQGLVIGEVLSKEKHPNADKLSLTKVNIGTGEALSIVCGAPNVAAGQKVVIATVGTTVYPLEGEPFEIKKSKIRGELSEGMICAEDEIGLGASHDGIMVLDSAAIPGTIAKDYFGLEDDFIFEIGLTPNRADAASHYGVARDLSAVLSKNIFDKKEIIRASLPSMDDFSVDNQSLEIPVVVEDNAACPRYSGITISGVKVEESPKWLKNRLLSIGLKPINNIVDITNFVLHETGQPLHAFDANKIEGKKVVVKKLPKGTKFTTLDEKERTLSGNDLMICSTKEGMCIAGIFGGMHSGITEKTVNLFLESAYFDPVSIRKSSREHGLKTDASFRFERGADPEMTVYALKRAATLIREIAGGKISSSIVDVYPKVVEPKTLFLAYKSTSRLIGFEIEKPIIKNILQGLGIQITAEDNEGLWLSIPPFKSDVTRQEDVIEEILRIYGYNTNNDAGQIRMSFRNFKGLLSEKAKNTVSDFLASNGFTEIMNNSLTNVVYLEGYNDLKVVDNVNILNPLSNELGALRQTLLFGGLESIAYNRNRKRPDLKLFEFGNTYRLNPELKDAANQLDKYVEKFRFSIFITGNSQSKTWNAAEESSNFFHLKKHVLAVFERMGLNIKIQSLPESKLEFFAYGLTIVSGKTELAHFGQLKKSVLKPFDIQQEVFFAEADWENMLRLAEKVEIRYKEISKYPEVRRDLALLIDKAVKYGELEHVAFQTERKLLKNVGLFDVYEGEQVEKGKKSYAMSFILQDEEKTLTDEQIEKTMQKLAENFRKNFGAVVR